MVLVTVGSSWFCRISRLVFLDQMFMFTFAHKTRKRTAIRVGIPVGFFYFYLTFYLISNLYKGVVT